MLTDRLLAALSQSQGRPQATASSRLMRAMSARGGKKDAKYASLAALPPYGEIKHADTLNGAAPSATGAFQDTAFQDDAYQVF